MDSQSSAMTINDGTLAERDIAITLWGSKSQIRPLSRRHSGS